MRTALAGILRINISPKYTAGTEAIIKPAILPTTTSRIDLVFCRQKNCRNLRFIADFRQEKQDDRCRKCAVFQHLLSGSSSLSGNSSHNPTAIKLPPTTHFMTSGEIADASQTPSAAETRWFNRVAIKIPATIAFLWAKRAAKKEREQLRLIADFGNSNTQRRGEKSFHDLRYSTEKRANKKRCAYRPQGYGQRLRLACLPVVRKMPPP